MQLVNVVNENGIAIIEMDDGKNNVISPSMLDALNHALDRAEQSQSIVILTGREGIFSAGFDLGILKTSALQAMRMLLSGFKLARRLLAFPRPVIAACNGHAIAMGSFLLLAADYRIGSRGNFKIVANEVKIGLTMPHSAIALCRQRLTPTHFNRAVLLSEQYSPETAVLSGFLDEVVNQDELRACALQYANNLKDLDIEAHKRSKLRLRHGLLKSLGQAIRKDRIDFVAQGFRRATK